MSISEMDEDLRRSVRVHEGFRSEPYLDTAGKWTFGYGFNIDSGITMEEAELLMRHRLEQGIDRLTYYGWWFGLTDDRQRALAEMVYQLGFAGFQKFRKMIAALEAEDHQTAADEMLDSQWAEQTPVRAKHCAELMRTG